MLKGFVDRRNDLKCVVPNYILLGAAAILVSIIGFKFLAALQLGSRRLPESHEKFVICQVPCYTEGEASLTRTINSLALLDYDDKRKLLFVICDGISETFGLFMLRFRHDHWHWERPSYSAHST